MSDLAGVMESAGGFITEVPGQREQQAVVDDMGDEESKFDEFSDDEDEQSKNQYYQVDDAEPPTNYDDPYSTLPAKIKLFSIKKDVTSSITFSQSNPREREEFLKIIGMEHFDALISDAFWYFICAKIKDNPEPYAAHNEFLLDRMAANYVSYTLVEDPEISASTKQSFFTGFYNHLSQAVYHCLKTAFPKNRNMIEKPSTKRDLLNTFSELLTVMVIPSAKYQQLTEYSTVEG